MMPDAKHNENPGNALCGKFREEANWLVVVINPLYWKRSSKLLIMYLDQYGKDKQKGSVVVIRTSNHSLSPTVLTSLGPSQHGPSGLEVLCHTTKIKPFQPRTLKHGVCLIKVYCTLE